MKKDHYSVLGVTPTSEDVVIRAAYHALMRRYHPDADPSEGAAERSRAINEAYAVLRDPEKRSRYDGALASQDLRFEPAAHAEPPERRGSRVGPAAAIGFALLAVAMVAFAVLPPVGQLTMPELPFGGKEAPTSKSEPVRASAPQPRAARHAAVSRLAPREIHETEEAKPIEPVQVAEATVSKTVARTAEPEPRLTSPPAPPPRPGLPAQTAQPAQAVQTSAGCAQSGSRAEQMICGNSNLSSLDRQLALLYRQSWKQADENKRAALLGTRQRFNERRDSCGSPNCMTTAYTSRLKEISDIMAGRVQQ